MEQKQSKTLRIIVVVAVIAIVGLAVWFTSSRLNGPSFCFNFVRDMQFGDREVKNPVNKGFMTPGGLVIYLETVPLQTALKKEGFYIDPYEANGGQVYAGAFFGPSTRVAVMDFQKKYGMGDTGEVNNDTLEKLAEIYKCPEALATSTVATSTKR